MLLEIGGGNTFCFAEDFSVAHGDHGRPLPYRIATHCLRIIFHLDLRHKQFASIFPRYAGQSLIKFGRDSAVDKHEHDWQTSSKNAIYALITGVYRCIEYLNHRNTLSQ